MRDNTCNYSNFYSFVLHGMYYKYIFVVCKLVIWRPQQDSNLHLILRRNLFYPVELWGRQSVFYSFYFNIASCGCHLYNASK